MLEIVVKWRLEFFKYVDLFFVGGILQCFRVSSRYVRNITIRVIYTLKRLEISVCILHLIKIWLAE